jgi:hypothetical protein
VFKVGWEILRKRLFRGLDLVSIQRRKKALNDYGSGLVPFLVRRPFSESMVSRNKDMLEFKETPVLI